VQADDANLLVAALGLAYKYLDLGTLRRAFVAVDSAPNGLHLVDALGNEGLSPARVDKLRRGADLASRLRTDAIYGMVVLRNRLVGGAMLNACMEESRRSGYEKNLSQVLIERGVLTDPLHVAIEGLLAEVVPDLFAKERALASTIDLENDSEESAELKLAVLIGEVSAKVSFLNRTDFDAALMAQEKIAQGIAPEDATRSDVDTRETAASHPAIKLQLPDQPVAQSLPTDDAIKGYELLDKLGSGAMGAVLKARRRDTGEIVALKILKPALAADREFRDRFQREAKAVSRLSHPNIIRAIQVGKSGEYYYFAMEFVNGRTASEMVKDQGKLPEVLAIKIVRCIGAALAHAWRHKIVHRDIKPDNVMISTTGDVKLTDLGLARTTKQDSTLTITGVVMGSPAYISPEQATGEKNLDIRSDLYSLGATLYHMLAGVVPYDGETPLHVMLKHMNDPVPDVRKLAPAVSEATRLLIMRMMAKKPAGRIQKASQVEALAKSIEQALLQGRVPQIPTSLAPPKPKPKPKPKPAPAPAPAPASQSPSGSGKVSKKGGRSGSSSMGRTSLSGEGPGKRKRQKEIGQRLKRMKKKRRF
jgi:serine/threonine protein kinase